MSFEITPELSHYYALQLWADYLQAKAQWEHTHTEHASCPLPVPTETIRALHTTRDRMTDLLSKLRRTPEHKAAFGW